jgi:hypothetical protein
MVQLGRSTLNIARRQPKQIDIKKRLIGMLEGAVVTLVMSTVTLFALIGDDIRLWSFSKSSDPIFLVLMVLSMIMFTAEIIMTTVVIDGFKYSFFFWLDIIATASLIPDIDWIRDAITLLCFGTSPKRFSLDVTPGEITTQSVQQEKIA